MEFMRSDVLYLAFCLNPSLFHDPRYPKLTPTDFATALRTLDHLASKYEVNKGVVLTQWSDYIARSGIFSIDGIWDALSTDGFSATSWWTMVRGMGYEELGSIALRLLNIPTSSAAAERNWSSINYIHDTKRNRLHTDRATDLVYVYEALRVREAKPIKVNRKSTREDVEGVEDDLSDRTDSGNEGDVEE
jgi:hAT family C-terminal dimerisation region